MNLNLSSDLCECGRSGGLVVCAPDSGSRGSGSRPGQVIVLRLGQDALLSQEYKWVLANCQGNLTKCSGVTYNGLASHPGGVAIPLVASCH